MTKLQTAEREAAIVSLREIIKPGDTVYTLVESAARSGMSRTIRVLVPTIDGVRDGQGRGTAKVEFLHPNYSVAVILGLRRAKRGDGVIIGGCGMDMGFELVYRLSHALYPEYTCLGAGGKCPSNYHTNYRSRVRCDGVGAGDDRRMCYRPSPWGRHDIPADWPRGADRVFSADDTGGDGAVTLPGQLLACLFDSTGDVAQPYEICPTCQGAGDLENPEGAERFDLVHADGYCLRQRWL